MTRLVVLTIAGLLAGSMQTSADETIAISVRPTVATFPGSAHLKVLVTRDAKNRVLVWEVDGPGYYRSSSQELDGASAPRIYQFLLQGLPPGEFEVRATVRRSDRTVARDRCTIRVIGRPS